MPTNHNGFTLIETVIFIIIVSIAVAAITTQVSQNVQHSADAVLRQKAIALSHQFLDQMQTARWDETTPIGGGTAPGQTGPGLDAGETCTFSDIDDFDDFDCFSGTSLGDGYSITITVTNGAGGWVVPGNSHKKALISVATPMNETLAITLYRANY